jgi:hypothetical protein
MLKRLQSPRMFASGERASITKSRRTSKTEFDVHGNDGSIKVEQYRALHLSRRRKVGVAMPWWISKLPLC